MDGRVGGWMDEYTACLDRWNSWLRGEVRGGGRRQMEPEKRGEDEREGRRDNGEVVGMERPLCTLVGSELNSYEN